MKTCLSFGAGVQTTAMLVLVAEGRMPRPDAIAFADTGSEKPETYVYLRDVLLPYAESNGVTIEILGPEWRTKSYAATLEQYCLDHHMIPASFNRWCTAQYKLQALRNFHRRRLSATSAHPVESWIGISTDESRRAIPSIAADEIKRYPLIEFKLDRADCQRITEGAGLPPAPKSGCWFCPFQRRAQWQEMKRERPEQFAGALAMERNASPKKTGGARYLPMFGSLEAVAAQDELPGFDEAIAAEGQCVTGACFV